MFAKLLRLLLTDCKKYGGLSPPALTLSGELRRAPMCDDCQSQSESARADAVMSLSDFFYPQLDLRSDETAS